MERFRYSYSTSGRSAEGLSASIGRMAQLGYDAVELGGELPVEEAGGIRHLLDGAGMVVSSVCPRFTSGRDLAHPIARYVGMRCAMFGGLPISRALWGRRRS
jgi:hypothetical protein